MSYIYKDINVRDPFVTDSKDLVLEDTKVVIQSLHRLITTQVGSIPYFRNYGLDIKRFCQYPLTEETIDTIYQYAKNKMEAFETRASVERADVDVSIEKGEIYFTFWIMVKATSVVSQLQWTVQVSTY